MEVESGLGVRRGEKRPVRAHRTGLHCNGCSTSSFMALAILCGVLLALRPSVAFSLVGATAGALSISSTGEAHYSIPLFVPPGINGLQPKLSIDYASRAENGLLGVGWTLGGLPSISSCPAAYAVPGGYCLGGNRLRLVAGTQGAHGSTYQTEVETFSRITLNKPGGPATQWFFVEGRDGLQYEYGSSPDSRFSASWAISKISDRAGNSIVFTYTVDATNGGYRPNEIQYAHAAGSAVAIVRFVYETRPDPVVKSFSGEDAFTQIYRVDRIDVEHGGSLIRRYDLSYGAVGSSGRSRLASVQECSSASVCFGPTQVAWPADSAGFGAEGTTGTVVQTMNAAIPGDMNGDGLEDLAYFDPDYGSWRVMFGGSSGTLSAPYNTGLATSAAFYSRALSADIDGDGKRDVLVPDGSGVGVWHWLRQNAAGTWLYSSLGVAANGSAGNAWVMDVDGDGRDDIVWRHDDYQLRWFRNTSTATTTSFSAVLIAWQSVYTEQRLSPSPFGNNSQTFRRHVRVGDFNRDGTDDVILPIRWVQYANPGEQGDVSYEEQRITVFTGSPTGLQQGPVVYQRSGPIGGVPQVNVNPADLNDDTFADFFYYTGDPFNGIPNQWTLSLSGRPSWSATATGRSSNEYETVNLDWDGDGRTDLLSRNASTGYWDLLRSTGTSLAAPVSTGMPAIGAGSAPKVMDINGDGLADIAYLDTSSVLKYRLHRPRPDLVSSVTDGLGNQVSFTFKPITSGTCYARDGAPPAFPSKAFADPLYVACSTAGSDGIGGTYTVSYQYFNANVHHQGRGLLGFSRRAATDSRNGLVTTQEYSQDASNYERIGALTRESVRQSASGPLVSDVVNTWSRHVYSTGSTERRLPYISQQVSKRYEVGGVANGVHVATVTSIQTVDTWGTPTDRTVTTTEVATGLNAGSSFTERTWHLAVTNDAVNWCLGKPTQTQLIKSHTLAGGTQLTRSLNHGWDYANCRMTQEVVEPGNTQWQVTTDYGYDVFGNTSGVTITPVGQPARTTSMNWGSDGRAPRSVTNALSQTSSIGWDLARGRVLSKTDPNGLAVTLEYDGFGRLYKEHRPDRTTTVIERAACVASCGLDSLAVEQLTISQMNRDTNAIFETSFVVLDTWGRPRKEMRHELGGGTSQILTQYTNDGTVLRSSTPHFSGMPFQWTTFSYDQINRRTGASRPVSDDFDASTWTIGTAYEGLTVRETDPMGKSTQYKLNAVGRPVQVIDSGTYDTDYEYDSFGNLLKTRDYLGTEIVIGYNVRGMKISSSDPDAGAWSYNYFPTGELKSQTNAKAQTVSFTYDKLSRRTTRTEPEGLTTWTWGISAAARNIGQLQSVTSPGNFAESYTYDSVGKVSGVTTSAAGTSYTINYGYSAAHGKLGSITYPVSTGTTRFNVQYKYAFDLDPANKSGRLSSVTDGTSGAAYWTAVDSNAFGQVNNVALGNGLNSILSYDTITGGLTSIDTTGGGGATLQSLDYRWNKAGSLKQRKDVTQNIWEDFAYDNLHRLDTVHRNNVLSLDLAYGATGNITSKSDVGAYAYHAVKKHAVTSAGTNTYAYDANGNMQTRNGSAVTWYSYDLPTTINQAGGSYSTFYYGADRQRYRQLSSIGGATAESTIYIGGVFEKITRSTGVTEHKHFVVAESGAVAMVNRKSGGVTETVYLLKDHLGSTDKITSSTGALLVALSYDAFGKRRGSNWSGAPTAAQSTTVSNTTRAGYTGHEHLDNIGMIHMNGRVYDVASGRFVSADPFVQAPYSSQSLNRFSYVFNNPLSFTDPSGFSACDEDAQAGGCGGTGPLPEPGHLPFPGCDLNCGGGGGPAIPFDASDPSQWTGEFRLSTIDNLGSLGGSNSGAKPGDFVNGGLNEGLTYDSDGNIAGERGLVTGDVLPWLVGGVQIRGAQAAVVGVERAVAVSKKGIALVEANLARFEAWAPNGAMVERLRTALSHGKKVTGADANFYLHEIAEGTVRARGLTYDAAHAAALKKYGVSPYSIYHPEVIQAYRSEFNNAWRGFWGLE